MFCFVFFSENRFHYAFLTGLEVARPQTHRHLPALLWSAGIKDVYQHTQLAICFLSFRNCLPNNVNFKSKT